MIFAVLYFLLVKGDPHPHNGETKTFLIFWFLSDLQTYSRS